MALDGGRAGWRLAGVACARRVARAMPGRAGDRRVMGDDGVRRSWVAVRATGVRVMGRWRRVGRVDGCIGLGCMGRMHGAGIGMDGVMSCMMGAMMGRVLSMTAYVQRWLCAC